MTRGEILSLDCDRANEVRGNWQQTVLRSKEKGRTFLPNDVAVELPDRLLFLAT